MGWLINVAIIIIIEFEFQALQEFRVILQRLYISSLMSFKQWKQRI